MYKSYVNVKKQKPLNLILVDAYRTEEVPCRIHNECDFCFGVGIGIKRVVIAGVNMQFVHGKMMPRLKAYAVLIPYINWRTRRRKAQA